MFLKIKTPIIEKRKKNIYIQLYIYIYTYIYIYIYIYKLLKKLLSNEIFTKME